MRAYALTRLAKADVFDIWSYIAGDSEDSADRVEQAIYGACAFVAEAPNRGHTRPSLTPRALRFWTLTRYPIRSCIGRRRFPSRLSPFCRENETYGAS